MSGASPRSDGSSSDQTDPGDDGSEKLAALISQQRQAFDTSFARPIQQSTEERIRLLTIWVGDSRYALRMNDLLALQPGRKISPLPDARPEILGIAGVRGQIVAVVSLARMLGHADSAEGQRWLVLAGERETLGFAFERVEGQHAVLAADLRSDTRGQAYVHHLVKTPDGLCSVLDVESIARTVYGWKSAPSFRTYSSPSQLPTKER